MSHPSFNGAVAAPKSALLRGTLIAAAVAGAILTVAVLPAEYGIDPTGIGKALGLTALHSASTATAPVAPPLSQVAAPGEIRAPTIASSQTVAYRADEREVILPAGNGVEVKTRLAKGATLIYSWKTKNGELLNHDFHGEPVAAKEDEFESFIKEQDVSRSSGSLIAPFTGVHGWYWKNTTDAPVTLVLNASGFYSEIYKK